MGDGWAFGLVCRADGSSDHNISISVCSGLQSSSFTISSVNASNSNATYILKSIDIFLFKIDIKEVKVEGLVYHLLDRKEWIGQASAIECIRGEKDGFVNAGSWIEPQI